MDHKNWYGLPTWRDSDGAGRQNENTSKKALKADTRVIRLMTDAGMLDIAERAP